MLWHLTHVYDAQKNDQNDACLPLFTVKVKVTTPPRA